MLYQQLQRLVANFSGIINPSHPVPLTIIYHYTLNSSVCTMLPAISLYALIKGYALELGSYFIQSNSTGPINFTKIMCTIIFAASW